MATAVLGYGIVYSISTTTGGSTYTTLIEVTDIEMAADDAEEVDVTHYGSPTRTREYIAGVITKGEGNITVNWVPGNGTDTLLRGLLASGETRNHKIAFPGTPGATVIFPAFIKGRSVSLPIDDRLQATYTVKAAGAETWS